MDFAAQLKLLEDAQGDPARLALASVELLLSARPAEEREKVREALEAAAIPHWFDEKTLAALLEIPEPDAVARMVRLRELNVVEPFAARDPGTMNVNETARKPIRSRMAAEAPDRFRTLSARACIHFANESAAPGLIEALFHRFASEPETAIQECETFFDGWHKTGERESLLTLGMALDELLAPERQGLSSGEERATALYHLAQIRYYYPRPGDDLIQTATMARAALAEYRKEETASRIPSVRTFFGCVLVDLDDRNSPTGSDRVEGVPIFVSYAKEDKEFCKQLEKALASHKRAGLVQIWTDASIEPSQEWERRIFTELDAALVFILLLSNDSLDSAFIMNEEYQRAMVRHAKGKCTVLPVLVRPCRYDVLELGKIQVTIPGGKPVSEHHNQDAAWFEVTQVIDKVIAKLRGR